MIILDFSTGLELIDLCKANNMSISEIMLQRECMVSNLDREQIIKKLEETALVMIDSVKRGLKNKETSLGGLIGGQAALLTEYIASNSTILSQDILQVATNSIGVMEINSIMGKIVAAPTAGSCGVFPGVLVYIIEKFNLSNENIIHGILTASAIGYIVAKNATISGAEGGCQAEIGTATAMTSAAIVSMRGGSPIQALDAAAFSFKNILGLVCDPIAGLVECPCTKRNALGALNAMLCADFVLAGIKSIIPFDEVVGVMYKIGLNMSIDLKETAIGGLAGTKTGQALKKEIFK